MNKLSEFYDQIYKNTCKKNKDIVYLVMQHILGISRQQLQVGSLKDTISQGNPVRFIDAFVHSIHLERIGDKPRLQTL